MADRSPVNRSFSHSSRTAKTDGHSSKGSSRKDDAQWLYDGDAEGPDAWRAGHGETDAQLRWTKKQLHKSSSSELGSNGKKRTKSKSKPKKEQEEAPKSPFTLGDDDPAEDDPVKAASKGKALPSDAVDLVTEDPKAVEDARLRSRSRGEPQTKAPAHVYRHNSNVISEMAGETEEVYDEQGQVGGGERRTSEDVGMRDATGEEKEGVKTTQRVGEASGGAGGGSYVRRAGAWGHDDGAEGNPWA